MKEWIKLTISIIGALILIGLLWLFLVYVPYKVQYYIFMSTMCFILFGSLVGVIYKLFK